MSNHIIKLYRPGNGTEGEVFMDRWCRHCARDLAMSEGKDMEECDDDEMCKIIGNTMAFDIGDPEYPNEWQYDHKGMPVCTAFVQAGMPVPLKDDLTMDLFA